MIGIRINGRVAGVDVEGRTDCPLVFLTEAAVTRMQRRDEGPATVHADHSEVPGLGGTGKAGRDEYRRPALRIADVIAIGCARIRERPDLVGQEPKDGRPHG